MDEKPFLPTKQKLRKARKKGQVATSPFFAMALQILVAFAVLYGASGYIERRVRHLASYIFSHLSALSAEEGLAFVFRGAIFWLAALLLFFLAVCILSHLLLRGWIWSFERLKGGKRPVYSLVTAFFKAGLLALLGILFLRNFSPRPLLLATSLMLACVALGLIDWLYQKRRFIEQMKMSKEELKEEQKESEPTKRSLK